MTQTMTCCNLMAKLGNMKQGRFITTKYMMQRTQGYYKYEPNVPGCELRFCHLEIHDLSPQLFSGMFHCLATVTTYTTLELKLVDQKPSVAVK